MFIGKDGCRNGLTAPMPSPETVTIACGWLYARLRPAWGGRMTHLWHADYGDILVPITEQDFEPFNWPRAGAYPAVSLSQPALSRFLRPYGYPP